MNNTPIGNRKSIVLVGNRNAGKSTIFNSLLGFDRSIVSSVAGTTTDPVWKASELIGYGPVRIVDTAGLDDIGGLGAQRIAKSEEEMRDSDLLIYVFNIEELLNTEEVGIRKKIKDLRDKYKDKELIFIVNKVDLVEEEVLRSLQIKYADLVFISTMSEDKTWLDNLNKVIIEKLKDTEEDKKLLDGMLKSGDTALLVVPIDNEAPKGRLILPQVQVIRACLDEGIKVIVCRDSELEETLRENSNINLVITDSKVFDTVARLVPESIKLTSFSILFAREKGDIEEFLSGAKYLEKLNDGDKVLIAESCTHTVSHEDIGQVVIPKLIKKKTGKNIEFEFIYGKSLPQDLERFSMIVQCGGCMMTRNNMMSRVYAARENNIAITNYGVILAYLKGVFERAVY
ncbi:MAG: [FeFe] hydrogenase H-cluster maturation GTPase HydF [Peptostreptococcus sp.]|uniref:[FeFe] hydrogenase H-cluster maturation GTPase HydF n=1 Tax=Peptostreptococcus sp. TaxID=1262 RepID=UPI002FC666A9